MCREIFSCKNSSLSDDHLVFWHRTSDNFDLSLSFDSQSKLLHGSFLSSLTCSFPNSMPIVSSPVTSPPLVILPIRLIPSTELQKQLMIQPVKYQWSLICAIFSPQSSKWDPTVIDTCCNHDLSLLTLSSPSPTFSCSVASERLQAFLSVSGGELVEQEMLTWLVVMPGCRAVVAGSPGEGGTSEMAPTYCCTDQLSTLTWMGRGQRSSHLVQICSFPMPNYSCWKQLVKWNQSQLFCQGLKLY